MEIITVILGVAAYGFSRWNRPACKFWRKVSKDPNGSFLMLKSDPTWKIEEQKDGEAYIKLLHHNEWSGPYLLYIPMLNKTVYIFGKYPGYLAYQKKYLNKVKSNSTENPN